MTEDALKLTVYLGERARVADGGFAGDALMAIAARHEVRASVLLRGMAGFGEKHRLRTDRLLTLSEDLPLVAVAVDARPRIEAALADVVALPFQGLVTLERARLVTGRTDAAPPGAPDEGTKLTLYLGRHERYGGRPAHEAVLDVLRDAGVAGATVLLGVDGTVHGVRRRARFTGRNTAVPLMVVAIGATPRIAAALERLDDLSGDRPLATLERVRLCKRGGVRLGEPRHVAGTDPSGLGVWQKLTVFAGEQSRHRGAPLHAELVQELRRAGAAGATTLRGIRGYHGDHEPHGDTLWQLRRRAPVVTVVIDTPERIRGWFPIVDALTDETGLVTSELVPALRSTGAGPPHGGLALARVS